MSEQEKNIAAEEAENNIVTEEISVENEIALSGSETTEAVAKKRASGAPNIFVDGLCRFLSWFGFSTKYYKGSKHGGKIFMDILDYLVLTFVGLIMLYPFWWMICASFASDGISLSSTIFWFVNPTWGAGQEIFYNYTWFMEYVPNVTAGATFWRIVFNTLLYSVVPVVVGVLTSASAAFAFAKIEWKAREFVFFFLLAAIMVPGPTIMITQYCIYNALGWDSNGLAMWVPGLFGSIMTAFFIRQFLYGLPTSIVEAAKIDGAGYWRIFWGFIVPLAMPAIMAQGILSFFGCWNNYLGCFIMINNEEWYNLPVAIQKISNLFNGGAMNPAVTIAGSVMSVIPVLVLFAIFQKQIIGSLMLTGSKE